MDAAYCPACTALPPDLDLEETRVNGAKVQVEYICCDCGSVFIEYFQSTGTEIIRKGWGA